MPTILYAMQSSSAQFDPEYIQQQEEGKKTDTDIINMQNCDKYVPLAPFSGLSNTSHSSNKHSRAEQKEKRTSDSILPNHSLTMPTKKHKRYFCNTAGTFHFPLKNFRAQRTKHE